MPSNDTPAIFSATATVETIYVEAEYDNLTGRFCAITGEGDRKTIHQSPLIDELVAKITAALKAEQRDGAEIMIYLSGQFGFAAMSHPAGEKSRYAVITALDLATMCPKPDPRFNPAAAASCPERSCALILAGRGAAPPPFRDQTGQDGRSLVSLGLGHHLGVIRLAGGPVGRFDGGQSGPPRLHEPVTEPSQVGPGRPPSPVRLPGPEPQGLAGHVGRIRREFVEVGRDLQPGVDLVRISFYRQ